MKPSPEVASVRALNIRFAASIPAVDTASGAERTDSERKIRPSVADRLKSWADSFQRDPGAETRAAEERRQRLLEHLNRAVADAPEDTPIRDIIRGLNRHWDD